MDRMKLLPPQGRQTMTMISDLPNDLEVEILSRVLAKSLWELKTTCKRWYALFRDLRFVEKNKRLGKAARESMLLSSNMVYSIAGGDLHSSKTPVQLTGKLKDLKGSKDLDFYEILHCDSLMLCKLYSTKGNTKLVVWNPCTGQTRKIKPRTLYHYEDKYAIGYSRSSSSGHSYKILRYWRYKNDQKVWVAVYEIYELSSDSLRVHDSLPLDYYIYFSGMSLKGDTYWVAQDDETPLFLMKFDFTAERLVRIHLPFQSIGSEVIATLSVVKDEKLALLHINATSGVMKIWVSNKIDDEEAKDFSWRSYFLLNMDPAKFNLDVESFLLDEENKVALCCGSKQTGDGHKTGIYIVGEGMYELVYEDTMKPSDAIFPSVLTYLPSLAIIQPKRHKRRRLSDT